VSNAVCAAILELSHGWDSNDEQNETYVVKDVAELRQLLETSLASIQTVARSL